MTSKVRSIESGISHIEECLLNLEALVKFGLHQVEHCEPAEFGAMRDAWCTMMYMIQDQVKAAHELNGEIEVIDRHQRYSGEARH